MTMITEQLNPYLDWPTIRRIQSLGLKVAILLPLQIKDLYEDAHRRMELTGDPNGDPVLAHYDEKD